MLKEGSVHGRFQPFHNDHLEYLLATFEQVEFVWIGITQYDIVTLNACQASPNRVECLANPLSYFERTAIIRQALVENGINSSRFAFVPFPIETPMALGQFLSKTVPCFTTIREPWNKKKLEILTAQGYEVKVLWQRLEDKTISSTLIRTLILADDQRWQTMVAKSTVTILQQLDIKSRLVKLTPLS